MNLAICTPEQRRLIMKRRRQARWAREWRARNPEISRERSRQMRKKLVARGYYRKGGKGYSKPVTSEKRRAYFRWYNANRRLSRDELRA